MMIFRKSLLLSLLISFVFPLYAAWASNPCDEFSRIQLDDAAKAKIQRGETVPYFIEADGPWPKIFVFKKVSGTAREAMALFSDINHQKTYFPSLKQSSVLSKPKQNSWIGQFEIRMKWPMPNERFKMEIEAFEYGDFYESRARQFDGENISSGEICARFEKLSADHTVVGYYSYLTSSHALAGAVTGTVKQMTVELGQTFEKEMVRIKNQDPQKLSQQIADLENALGTSDLFSDL